MADESIEQMRLEFVADASEAVERLSRRLAALGEGNTYPRQLVDSVFRTAHSLRGTAGMFGFDEVSRLAGSFENLLEAVRGEKIAADPCLAGLAIEVLDQIPVLLRNENDEAASAQSRALGERIDLLLASSSEPAASAEAKPTAAGAKSLDGSVQADSKASGPTPLVPVPDAGSAAQEPRTDGPMGRVAAAGGSALSVKVDISVLDSIMSTVSELLSTRLALLAIARGLPATGDSRRLRDELLKLSYLFNKRMLDLEGSIIEARLVPMSMLFDRYSGEIRRLARQAGKQVETVFDGEATRIDRALLDRLYDPLLHLVRNAIDHGIEAPETRLRLGKPVRGRLLLRARQESSHVRIDVEDDGGGIDLEKVAQVAKAKGISLGDGRSALDVIFEPGFTTLDVTTDISGRGVGLDAVKTQIEELRGVVGLTTEPAKGTALSIWVPLTLVVSRGMLVEESGVPVAMPLGCVIEVLRVNRKLAHEVTHGGVIEYKAATVSVLALSEMLKTGPTEPQFAVILGIGGKRRAILVGRVSGETEIVARPLPEAISFPRFIAGATELHDGRAAIIIQPANILGSEAETQASGDRYVSTGSACGEENAIDGVLRTLVLRRGTHHFAVPFAWLKDVLPEKRVTEIPAIGDVCEGIFFVKGLCHGLLRLPASGSCSDESRRKVITLNCPSRCGIRIDDAIGECAVPLSTVKFSPGGEEASALLSVGTFEWKGINVNLLALRPDMAQGLSAAGLPGEIAAGLMTLP